MINLPLQISVPQIWQGTFDKNQWNSINFIVGANGTGKSLFSNSLKDQLQNKGLTVRLLTAERLAGFEKSSYSSFSSSYFDRGLDISNFKSCKQLGEQFGLSTSAFIILQERLDLRIKIESLLSDLFKKTIRLVEEGGYLKPKMQSLTGGDEYGLKEQECHGLKEIISLLTFLYDEKNNCIIFDEPELHLHPQFQSFFLDEIRKLAGNPFDDPSKKMFFIITHSPYFMDFRSIDDLKNVIVCHNNEKPTFIEEGSIDAQDEYILRKFLPRFNTHHKQFFFSPNPVFVEGYTDQQIITLLFEKYEMKISASGSSVIDVGGKDELAVFYRLCKKLKIEARLVADYDALFRGKLREVFTSEEEVADYFTTNGYGANISNTIGEIERKLLSIADNLNTKKSSDSNVQKLIDYLKPLYVNKQDNLDKIRDAVYLAVYRFKVQIKDCVDGCLNSDVEYIVSGSFALTEAIKRANIFIIPQGELEHFFIKSTIDYLNITNKDKLFHDEKDFILSLDNKQEIENNYSDLIRILKESVPHIVVNTKKHLKYTLVEWIQKVQNAISRKEVKTLDQLKTNARIQYSIYSQILECADDGLVVNENDTFSCTVKIKLTLIGEEKIVHFDHTTTPQNFIFE
ncbi:MAG: AAA family ATPase [Bacteroidales bacterium]|nr:AAA family ATPase [Bacteroidales bacterium]